MEVKTVVQKPKRRSISLHTKYKIIKEVERGEKSKSFIAQEYGINSSTLTEMVKQRDAIYKAVQTNDFALNRKRLRWGKYGDLEDELYKWYSETSRRQARVISVQDLTKKANEIAKRLGITSFKASLGFVYRFKERRGIASQHAARSGKNNTSSDRTQWNEGISHDALQQQEMLTRPYGHNEAWEAMSQSQMQINSGRTNITTYEHTDPDKDNSFQHNAFEDQNLLVIKSEPMEDSSYTNPMEMIPTDGTYQEAVNTCLHAESAVQLGIGAGQNIACEDQNCFLGANKRTEGASKSTVPESEGRSIVSGSENSVGTCESIVGAGQGAVGTGLSIVSIDQSAFSRGQSAFGKGQSAFGKGQSSFGKGQSAARGQSIAGAGHKIVGAGHNIVGAGQNMIGACHSITSSIQSIVNAGQSIVNEGQCIAGGGHNIVDAGQNIIDAGECIVGAIKSIVDTGQNIVGAGQSIVGAGQNIVGARESIVEKGQSIEGEGQHIIGEGQTKMDADQNLMHPSYQAPRNRKDALNSGHSILNRGPRVACLEGHSPKRCRTSFGTFDTDIADKCTRSRSNSDERNIFTFDRDSSCTQLDPMHFNLEEAMKSFKYLSNFIKSQHTAVPIEVLSALQTLNVLLNNMEKGQQTRITDFFSLMHT
ncbi:hypothetical protein FSP39_007179 [Pinctada imbricata]|uniref:HTH CENPB-type domain-containing protein n=1 Tax=Pinctada imbricata TaxID=66713 RepID=A0AA89BVJ6_PINIB|nr:hypothetical protein FSP39_007179 [Pinctada imbricata]